MARPPRLGQGGEDACLTIPQMSKLQRPPELPRRLGGHELSDDRSHRPIHGIRGGPDDLRPFLVEIEEEVALQKLQFFHIGIA